MKIIVTTPAQAVCWFHHVNGFAKKGNLIGIKNQVRNTIKKGTPSIDSHIASMKFGEPKSTPIIKKILIDTGVMPTV